MVLFPVKLFEILQDPANNEIVSWKDDLGTFTIHNLEELLSRFDGMSMFSSFERQLQCYGFRKENCKPEAAEYRHKNAKFLPDPEDLLPEVKRNRRAAEPEDAAVVQVNPNLEDAAVVQVNPNLEEEAAVAQGNEGQIPETLLMFRENTEGAKKNKIIRDLMRELAEYLDDDEDS